MINVQNVLRDAPHFEKFCSVKDLHELSEKLRADPRFEVNVAGASSNRVPIHHIRFGTGKTKALILGGPHGHEPISGLTIASLLTLLHRDHKELTAADVEWHIIPCIDPDAALLNESWSQEVFSFENYIRNCYIPIRPQQVEFSFPVSYKKLVFDKLSKEAKVLKGVIDRVKPDFFFSLHNYAPLGGAFFALSRNIGQRPYDQIHDLAAQHRVDLKKTAMFGATSFSEGMCDLPSIKKYYDYLEDQGVDITEDIMRGWAGASAQDYVLQVNPDALVFIAELPLGQHPNTLSGQDTGEYLRRLNLRLFADRKFLAAVILEEWDKTNDDLDRNSPFYRKLFTELIATRGRLQQGVSEWYEEPLQHLLTRPEDSRIATKGDVIRVYMRGVYFLGSAYSFVRLLKQSRQTVVVRQATEKIEAIFVEMIDDLKRAIGTDQFEFTDHDTLSSLQLGSGLIALNAVLEP